MNMMNTLTRAGIFCALFSSAGAMALETSITVKADVDPSYGVLMADGNPLPENVSMSYNPANGLLPWKKYVKFYTNVDNANINVRLQDDAVITEPASSSTIALAVLLNGKTLSTTDSAFSFDTLFPKGVGTGTALPFTIQQDTTKTPIANVKVAGSYSGVVTLVVTKGTVPGGS